MQNACPRLASVQEENLPELADEIARLSAHLDAGTYRLLKLLGEFDRRGGWHGTGIRSCAHWLNWKCGIAMGAARERVRVARALPDLPKISAAMKEGRVSYSKVRAMTRVATPENEPALLEVALGGTASHVEQQVRLYRKSKRLEALQEENRRFARRELNWHRDEDGFWVFRGRLDPEAGAVVVRALERAVEHLYEEHKDVPEDVSAETPGGFDTAVSEPAAAQRADALVRMAEGFATGSKLGHAGGDRYLVNIHTDMDTLRENGNGAEAEIGDHGRVSAETSRRLACDCAIVHWHEDRNGHPLSIGRKSRTIPPAIRRALRRRDGGCRFPGCTCKRFVDAHHIRHWADGGETGMDNLVLLCRHHHRLVHEGGFGVRSGPNGAVEFTDPGGHRLAHGPETRFRGNVLALEARNRETGLEITTKTAVPAWYGDRLDPQMAVAALLACE